MLGMGALIDLLVNRTARRGALTALDGCTYTTAANATVNLATTPANGLRVAMVAARVNAAGAGDLCHWAVGALQMMVWKSQAGISSHTPYRDIKTTDGETVSITSNTASLVVHAAHEAL